MVAAIENQEPLTAAVVLTFDLMRGRPGVAAIISVEEAAEQYGLPYEVVLRSVQAAVGAAVDLIVARAKEV